MEKENKPIKCELCNREILHSGMANHIKTHNISIEDYVGMFGEFRDSKLNPQNNNNRKVNNTICKICSEEVTVVGMSNHLKRHKITSIDYIEKYGEFRPKYLDYENRANNTNKFICKICNTKLGSEKLLSYHLKTHNIEKIEYIKKYVFNNEIQYCKCGCKEIVNLLEQYPYRRDYVGEHSSSFANGMSGRTHKEESKRLMSETKKNRNDL